ncbi:hypothetical protein ABGB14_16055 [Nonomuraea sp. B10E15]|uniref:hypothetical protein n=1 Tax=Nonomuraea sp. B10E15 TaxID=3153560 RepID=UPI00325E3B89
MTTGTYVCREPGSAGSRPDHRRSTRPARPRYWSDSPVAEWPITVAGLTTVRGMPRSAAALRTVASPSRFEASYAPRRR